jgi:choline dehydrogenase-like flavoprotein
VPSEDICNHLGINWVEDHARGTDGPIQASFAGVIQDPISKAWVDTFTKLGRQLKRDPFSGKALGGYSSPITVDPSSKIRSYAANTYFAAASARQNLHVVTGALVEKILLEPRTDLVVARGVEVDIAGEKQTVTARKEVILAAGVFQTPKLLELSGIGNKYLLQSHGIDTLIDNPNVGENLQDHLMTGISFEAKDGIFTGDGLMRQEPEQVQAAMQMYTTARAGPLCAGGIGSYALMSAADLASQSARDELAALLSRDNHYTQAENGQTHFLRSILRNPKEATGALFMFPAQVNLHNDPKSTTFVQDFLPGNFISIGAALLHPFSRGSVHLTSSLPTSAPKIDPKYLTSPFDLLLLSHHLQTISAVATTQPFLSLLKPADSKAQRNHPSAYSACDTLDNAKAYVKATAISNNHPACTCAMLPRDKGGVVDDRLRVYGTRGLRVVDASVMPTIPRANTQATVYAVAERAADLIKGDHRHP